VVLVNKVLFPGLVRPDEQLQPSPDLATSWEASDDGLSYTFRLRPGVTWHDGHPFDANDVKFTFDQVLDLSSGSRLRSDFATVAGVDVVDSLTVRFRLSAPFAPLLTLLGYNAGILPEHLLRGKPLTDAITFNRSMPVGTGPFMVDRVTPGATISLVRNPAYYGARPELDRLVFRVVPDVNAQSPSLLRRARFITIEPANLASVEDAPGIAVSQVPVVQHWYVGFHAGNPLFASPLVRRALGYAIDRAAIISGVLRGYGDAPGGTIPIALREYFDSATPPIPYAPDSARALLARAGWRPAADGRLRNTAGVPFRFELLVDKGNPTREQAALAVQQDLDEMGIDVRSARWSLRHW
jgi:peptide/nickel transport system substrate-binding protein